MPDFQPLNTLNSAQVLVIGDIMLDRFVYGTVDRISPESPVPVLSIKREDTMIGGAGNALANLVGLQCKADIISVVGDDTESKELITVINDLGVDAAGIIHDQSRPTTVKTRYLAGHQQLLRSDAEKIAPLDQKIEQQILETATKMIKGKGALLLSDYGKGVLTESLLKKLILLANKSNIPVVIDPKGRDFSKYRGASVITPNKKELAEATNGAPTGSDEEIILAAQKLIDECGIEAVVATRSADGMSVIQKSAAPAHIPTHDIEVFDVSGAGDTVIATIAASLATDADLVTAARLANLAGSVVVTKVGTAPIRLQELQDAAAEQGAELAQGSGSTNRHRRGQILGWEDAAEQIKRWKARGLKVGFTNGCFDIVHFGHVSYLNNTRDHCDRLIVGLNKDSSVSVLKGPERPVHDEASRAEVLAALGAVDMVVLFGADQAGDDNTANALLETLKPDIYFKGGDYTEDQIPETPTVKAYGGEVNIMPVYEGHSTTNSIKKMKTDEAA